MEGITVDLQRYTFFFYKYAHNCGIEGVITLQSSKGITGKALAWPLFDVDLISIQFNQRMSQDLLSFRKSGKESERLAEENRDLRNMLQQLKVESAQKDLKIREIELEKYKIAQPLQEQIRTLQDSHAREIMQSKTAYQEQIKRLKGKLEGQSKNKIEGLTRQNEELKSQLQSQRDELKKASQIQMSILRSKLESERQQMRSQLQNEKNKAFASMQNREREVTLASKQQIQTFRKQYEDEIANLKATTGNEIQNLKTALASQRQVSKTKYDNLRTTLDERINVETKKIMDKYEKEKGQLRGSFIDEKAEMEDMLQTRNEEMKRKIGQFNEEKAKLIASHEAEADRLKKIIEGLEKKIAQDKKMIDNLQAQNFQLNSHVSSYDKSLGFYKEEIEHFDQFIEKNNSHLVEQFKCLDDLYSEPSLQKIKLTQLMTKQYRELVQAIKHPVMVKIINEKEVIINNYVGDQMITYLKAVEDIDVTDVYSIHSEKGKRFRRVIENITLFKSLQSQNINDTVDMYFNKKLLEKIKVILAKYSKEMASKNNEKGQLEFIKLGHQYYEMKDFLSNQIPEHEDFCQEQYRDIESSMNVGFKRFEQAYMLIGNSKNVEKFQDYINRAEHLKKFVIVMHAVKNHRKYAYHLEGALGLKMEDVKAVMLGTLSDYKKELKQKVDELLQTRVYYDCFLYQKIYKRLRVFDDILTKEENSYHSFNFTELYNKLVNATKIIKDQKINVASIIITQDKISTDALQREYAAIAFDASLKALYKQRLKTVLHSRTLTINRINENSLITSKTTEQFENYFIQATNLCEIKQINEIEEVTEHVKLYPAKISILASSLQPKFKQYYYATGEFKNLAENNTKIKSALEFQLFLQRQFKDHHATFKQKILETRYSKLPPPENEEECVFHMLLRLNESNLSKLNAVINDPEETLTDEHYEYFTNMTSSVSKYESGKLQEKLQKTIQSTIGQLEAKEWLEGDLNSAVERKMMAKINKLPNKDISFYRELFNMHKNKVIEERQRIMSSEKRILKEEQFNKLKEFVDQCQKHEAAGSKFNKLYTNILDEHVAYIYQNLDDSDKKCRFVENIYKLNLVSATKNVREIFKTKEHAAYFSKPDLVFIKDNVQLIENFEGQTQVDISKTVQQIANIFKLYSILKANTGKSLLDDEQQQKIQQEIASIRYNVTKSYLNLCHNVEHQNLFDQNCKRRHVLLGYIKIEIFLRLMKKIQTINPEQGYYEILEEYSKIMARCNNSIEKIFQEIKKFRFIKEDLVDDYHQREKVLAHLRRIQRYIEVFKEIKYELGKLEDYTKNNYLQQLPLSRFDYKDIVLIIEMTWIKEYAVVKKEIADMFTDNRWVVTNKYKLLLAEKQLVKEQNLLYFNEFIKEQYDFKKTVIEELMLIDGKCQRYVQEVQKENQFYTTHIRKLEEKRNNYINTEKERIRNKYSRLIAEVRNSFHEITSEKARQKKIESEINTLKNQQRTEEEKLLDYETKNIENCRAKANIKLKRWINKIFYINSIVDNVEQSFDKQIEQLCQRILFKMNQQMQKQDKNIKNEYFAQDIRLSKQASSLGVINISQLKSNHIIQAKSEIGNNELMVASEVHDENSETMERRSRSKVTDQNYQQKSMIQIDAPEEEEQIKAKVGTSRPDIQKGEVISPKVEKTPQSFAEKAQQEKSPQKPKQYAVNVHQIEKSQPKPQKSKPISLIKKILDGCPQLRNNESAKNKLNANYDEYMKQLYRVEKQYNQHQSESKLMKLVNETRQSAKELKPPILMARIFAVHAIFQSIAEQSDVSEGNPHQTQALAALLLVGNQNQGKSLANRLVELQPGEGKSRVVAGVNCFLALQGNQVYCAAFSKDLCERDKKQYQKLYQSFGVEEMIKYGSVYEHCSIAVDEGENTIQISKKILVGQEITSDQQEYVDKLTSLSKPNSKSNKVLVIDEIDTFFAPPYGQVYAPTITLQSIEVKNMIKFIWANRNNDKLAKIVKNSEQYTALMAKHPKISQLLENQVEIMTKSWNNYKNCSYQVQANDLVFKKQKKQPSFGSVFAACFEYDNKKISQKNYQKYLVINLKLGQASYAQLPKHFDSILGVGATISSLSQPQLQALKQQYGIRQIYHLPSKFDKENRKILGARSCKNDQHTKLLMKSVHVMKKIGRPTIIVFQTEDELGSFAEISDLTQYSADICKISESSSSQTRNSLISYAGSRGRITLTTYAVARGADFMVYDSQINEKGGVHVIQAYVPGKQEEFIQVYGRAARQGKTGSYEMIVTVEMLAMKQIKQVDDDDLIETLKNFWKTSSQKHSLQVQKIRQAAKSQHDKAFQVFGNLKNREKLYQSVLKWNYVETNSDTIRTIIAIDGTGTAVGSMSLAIKAFQEIIKQALDRIDDIIKQKNRKGSYEHKIIIFRNYSSKYEKLIEQSKFSKDGNELQAFMTTIKAEGGLGNEAHEALFYEIGKLCANERVDQIILIGDAGANKYEEIVKYRKKFSGEAYWSSKIPLLPKVENYLQPIIERQIPIHSMYILKNKPDSAESDKNVKLYFENLSQKNKGLCKQLSIAEKEKTMSELTNFIAERVLTQIGRDLVEVYGQKYSK